MADEEKKYVFINDKGEVGISSRNYGTPADPTNNV